MSSALPPLNLVAEPVGFQGVISFNQFTKFDPSNQQNTANLWLFNESGAGLNLVFQQSNNTHYLPAGAWGFFALAPNDSQVQVTITYLLPNPPVSQLNAVYYAPGEALPQSFTLGNSPIGIGGTVNTSSVQTLSNEGGPINTLIEDIGDVNFAQLYQVYSDGHALWSVDQSGVRHQIMKIQTAGNPLQLGQAGDITEVLGQLTVDSAIAVNPTSVHLVGGTGGTADMYQFAVGTVKIVVVIESAFQTGASNQLMALPTPFTHGSMVYSCGGVGSFALLASGTTQQVTVFDSGSGTGNATVSLDTNIFSNNIGGVPTAWDTLRHNSGAGAASSGLLIFIGV